MDNSSLPDDSRTAIRLDSVSKSYQLGASNRSLRHALPRLAGRVLGRSKGNAKRPNFWALRNINIQVSPGQSLGIIGPNGAGKTTILRLLSKITRPTEGVVRTSGRISALIELGAGFHPDLSGRDNIYLSAALLGMKREEIQARFDEIVAFSELERFLDTPVKRYSSGMYARLGFAVAAHVDPDILLTDEVLAVGDVAFQAKCFRKMAELKRNGTTIVYVTHALPTLRRVCDRAILLYKGQVIRDGTPSDVIETYIDNDEYASNLVSEHSSTVSHSDKLIESASSPVRITKVSVLDEEEKTIDSCRTGDSIRLRISYVADRPISNPSVTVKIHGLDGTLYTGFNSAWDGSTPEHIEGKGILDMRIGSLPLLNGRYLFSIILSDKDGLTVYDWHSRQYSIRIVGEARSFTHGLIHVPHEWYWHQNLTDSEGIPEGQ